MIEDKKATKEFSEFVAAMPTVAQLNEERRKRIFKRTKPETAIKRGLAEMKMLRKALFTFAPYPDVTSVLYRTIEETRNELHRVIERL